MRANDGDIVPMSGVVWPRVRKGRRNRPSGIVFYLGHAIQCRRKKTMALSLFKNADALYEQAIDLIKQGEFEKARGRLMKSIEKDGGPDDISSVLVCMIDMRGRLGDISAYRNLLNALKATAAREFTFGLTTVSVPMMIVQCELAVEEIQAFNMNGASTVLLEKGNRLLKLAQRYQSEVGNETLKMNEIFLNDTTRTGIREGMVLLAMGYESLASGTVWDDPKKAAEYQQIAYGYRKQVGDTGESNLRLVNDYSRTCKCWFCGRTASGLGIHFFPISSEISPMLRKSGEGEPLRSESEDYGSIYACRACYKGISARADDIAKAYHNQAMSEMRAMEARLQAEIVALWSAVRSIR